MRITKSEFARLAGVTKQAVSKAIAGSLGAAVANGEIDLDHASARSYLAAKGVNPPSDRPPGVKPHWKVQRGRPRREQSGPVPPLRQGEDLATQSDIVDTWGDLTLREIATRWGTFKTFEDVLDALKTIEEIRKTRLHNEEKEGGLIARDLVRTHVVGLIESTNRRLLTDAPKTIAARVASAVRSDQSAEDCERIVRDLVSAILEPERDRVVKVLREP